MQLHRKFLMWTFDIDGKIYRTDLGESYDYFKKYLFPTNTADSAQVSQIIYVCRDIMLNIPAGGKRWISSFWLWADW